MFFLDFNASVQICLVKLQGLHLRGGENELVKMRQREKMSGIQEPGLPQKWDTLLPTEQVAKSHNPQVGLHIWEVENQTPQLQFRIWEVGLHIWEVGLRTPQWGLHIQETGLHSPQGQLHIEEEGIHTSQFHIQEAGQHIWEVGFRVPEVGPHRQLGMAKRREKIVTL